jgi:hypothetical protein
MFGAVKRWWAWLWSGDVLPERERVMVEKLYQCIDALWERHTATDDALAHLERDWQLVCAHLDALERWWEEYGMRFGDVPDRLAALEGWAKGSTAGLEALERWARRVADVPGPAACKRCGDTRKVEYDDDGGKITYVSCPECNPMGVHPAVWGKVKPVAPAPPPAPPTAEQGLAAEFSRWRQAHAEGRT